ncbi:MAG: ABC transporter substrate-binding protein [Bacillota bacterium]
MSRIKLFALLTTIIFIASLFAGCGGNSAVKKDDMKEPVELTYYFLSYGEIKDLPLVEAKINEYLKPKINATIKLMPIADADYNQKLTTMASAGEPMDLVFTSFWAYPFIKAVNTGQLLALNELLDLYGPDVKKNEYPEYWPAVTVNGNIYAVPINGGIAYQQAYTFNKVLVEKYNVDLSAIKTFEDLYAALVKVKKQAPNLNGLACNSAYAPADEIDYVFDRDFPAAVKIDDPTCKVYNQFNDPRVIQLLKIYHEMYKLGIVPRDKINSGNVQLFRQGKTMCEINVFGPGLDGIMTRTYGFDTISIPANSRGVKSTFSATGNMLAISATSKHPERTMMFLNLLNSDPYLSNLCAYGIEGIHWKAVGTDRLDFLPQHLNYNISLVGNPFIGRLTPTDPDNLWDILKKANAVATKSPIFGFSFNPDPVKNEMSAIQNVKDEFVPHLFVGEVDVDSTLAKMNEKFTASGLDKVLSEMQRQIDAWKKTQK